MSSPPILKIYTLGRFTCEIDSQAIPAKAWSRDKSLQLLQFFITQRRNHFLHKEQIIDRIWSGNVSDQAFKVALHGLINVLEPKRNSRQPSQYILRQGQTYQLATDQLWIDVEAMEDHIQKAHEAQSNNDTNNTILHYQKAISLYQGTFLPNRIYEDWSSTLREHAQLLILGAYCTLAEIMLPNHPLESIRLTQHALQIDPCWESAYRIQIQAYLQKGNRPAALRCYQLCKDTLQKAYGVPPLPITQALQAEITKL